jgi:hypothetical protein
VSSTKQHYFLHMLTLVLSPYPSANHQPHPRLNLSHSCGHIPGSVLPYFLSFKYFISYTS